MRSTRRTNSELTTITTIHFRDLSTVGIPTVVFAKAFSDKVSHRGAQGVLLAPDNPFWRELRPRKKNPLAFFDESLRNEAGFAQKALRREIFLMNTACCVVLAETLACGQGKD